MSEQFPYNQLSGQDNLADVISICSEAIFSSLQELISKVSDLIEVVENKSL